jgi:glycolate oxidase FAD binding subunit
LILEVSLKVLPKPFFETTLRFTMREAEAIEQLNRWGGQPLPISASAWHGGVLIVRLSGSESAVNAAMQTMGGEQEKEADAFWRELRNHANEFLATASELAPVWRLSVPSTMPPLALQGEQLIEWGGAQRWLRTDADAATIRDIAQQAGGHATLFRGGDKRVGVFHPLAPAVAAIHRNLKNTFDPSGVFNPGRMYPDF